MQLDSRLGPTPSRVAATLIQMLEHCTLDDHLPFAKASFPPVHSWVEARHEGISEDYSILPQVCKIEVLQIFFSVVDDSELTVVCHLSSFVLCSTYIVDFDGLHQWSLPDAHPFLGFYVDEVFCCTTIQECSFIGHCMSGLKGEGNIHCIDLPNQCPEYSCVTPAFANASQPCYWLSGF